MYFNVQTIPLTGKMNSSNQDSSILATLVAKIQNGRDLVTADDLAQLEQVLIRDKAKLAAGEVSLRTNLTGHNIGMSFCHVEPPDQSYFALVQ
jgi:hypothetical protein